MALLIGSEGSESKSGTEAEQSQNLEQLENLLIETRKGVIQRLKESTNPYHNLKHTQEVIRHLVILLNNLNISLDERKRLLLKEAAWRHDDSHIGIRYRQKHNKFGILSTLNIEAGEPITENNLSNEEYAVELLKKELKGKISDEDLQFIIDAILATTFGQKDEKLLSPDKIKYYRPYEPKTSAQKLLALADISSFMDGWKSWLENSFLFLEESLKDEDEIDKTPENFDSWLESQKIFLSGYVSDLLNSFIDKEGNNILTDEYDKKLKDQLNKIITRIKLLQQNKSPTEERIELKAQFQERFGSLLRKRKFRDNYRNN